MSDADRARWNRRLLEPGELRAAFTQFEALEYVEDSVAGWVALVAQRTAQPQSGACWP